MHRLETEKNRAFGFRPSRLVIFLIELFLLFSLAWLGARFIWLILGFGPSLLERSDSQNLFATGYPSASLQPFSEAVEPVLWTSHFDPFQTLDSLQNNLQASPMSPTNLAIKLTGLRYGQKNTDGAASSATLLLPDGQERVFRAGDALIQGYYLKEIFKDHISLSHQGQLEALYFEDHARKASGDTTKKDQPTASHQRPKKEGKP